MKNKILPFAFLGLVIAFGMYVYKYPPKGVDPKVPIDTSKEICIDYSTYQKSKLTNGLVNDMVNIYRNNQLVNIEGSAARPINKDAYSIWFDLDTIKNFIYHFENDLKHNSQYANRKKGIRIYYAAYPEVNTWKTKTEYKDIAFMADDPLKIKYEKKHTLVMIPTLQNENGKICDVNLFDPNTFANGITKYEFNNRISYMPPAIRQQPVFALSPASNASSRTSSSSDDIAARNHGGLYPPNSVTDLGF